MFLFYLELLWPPGSQSTTLKGKCGGQWCCKLVESQHCILQLDAAGRAELAMPLLGSAAMGWNRMGWKRPIHALMALFSSH